MTETLAHLHVHSHYSLMDGLNTPHELVQAAKDLGQTSLAITDHGTLGGHRDMQKACKELGVKPILGLEAYISPTDRFDRREVKKRDDNTQLFHHLIIIAKNKVGYKNLNKLSEIAWTEGFYSKPRIDKEVLSQYAEGLIVLSGCLNGLIAKAIEKGDNEGAEAWINYFVETFGADFYIELQPDNPGRINLGLYSLARKHGVKCVATADCHWAHKQDRPIEEAMLILSTNPKKNKEATYDNTKGMPIFERLNALYPERPISFEHLDLYLQNRDEMRPKFMAMCLNDESLYDNSLEIADKVEDYDYYENLELLPQPKVDPDKRLEQLVDSGLKRLGLSGVPEYERRKREELDLLFEKQFSPYFLIVADLIAWAKKQKIRVGPGRGSAAGSLVCYALGITAVDPIKYGLLFFRFIDPDRPDWPDIDMDFEDRRRGEVKEYLRRKFKNVASISTFGTFKDKGVIRDASRVFAVPIGDVNKALKGIDPIPGKDFFEIFERSDKGSAFIKKYPEVMPLARGLRGRIKSTGIHAAGLVVAKDPISNYTPIETRTEPKNKVSGRIPVTALAMDDVADVGLLKLDLLGLKALSVLSDAVEQIERKTGKVIDLDALDLDDTRVFQELSNGRTVGVFQAEQPAYTDLLKKMGVDNFEDLAASNALVRPGARNTVGEMYIDRKNGREDVKFAHPILRQFTESTYGLIIYQEQVMLACTELGGMSMAEANKVRRIIGKKKDVREFEEYRERFVTGASVHIGDRAAEALWHDFEAHAGYSFNRSHAVVYSLISYWTAWLKLYYPLEFMYAVLKNEDDTDNLTKYLIETKRIGLKVLLPHVNKSEPYFVVEGDGIRFGLSSIKYISDTLAYRLIESRPFNNYSSLQELVQTKNSGLSTRVLQGLNAVGAAAFEDKPLTGQEKYNYWEYLNIPKFNNVELPEFTKNRIRPLDEFSEDESFIVMGMVTKIKRGKGWSRVEFVDESGTAAAFHNEETQVEPGQQYFMLIASNRIARYIPVDEVVEKAGTKDDALINYLMNKELWLTEGFYYVLRMEKRMTKARKLMGTLVLINHEGELRKVLVFPKEFANVYSKAKEGSTISARFTKLDDGGLCVREID